MIAKGVAAGEDVVVGGFKISGVPGVGDGAVDAGVIHQQMDFVQRVAAGNSLDGADVGFVHANNQITVSKLINLTGGAHEVSLQFLLPCPEKRKAIKELECPSF